MGTRAQFFIGDPSETDSREWLGCTAWDGYTSGFCGDAFKGVTTPGQFREAVAGLRERDDFTDPRTHSFPFPWTDDLYLTDYTYAFFGGRVQVTCYHHGWRDLEAVLTAPEDAEIWTSVDELPRDVPAPCSDGPRGPDSIIILSA